MNAFVQKIKEKINPSDYAGIKKVVLAYSGGLDTSIILKLLQEVLGADVVTLTLDFGQEEYKGLGLQKAKEKALSLGAKKAIVLDVKKEFVSDFVTKGIKANCLYEGDYPNSTAIGRPLIAKHLVKVAEKEGAQAVVHGCTGKGNDQVRFEVSISSMNPKLKVIAPVRDWQLNRDEEYDYAKEAGIPVSTSKKSPYSVDANLWGRSSECGVIEFPEKEVPEEVLQWITPPEKAPDAPEFVTLNFEGGIPVSMTMNSEKDGKRMKKIAGTTELILELNEIAGKNGVGIIEQMEDRVIGLKSHEFYECPAATVVLKAHKDLEKMVLTKEEMKFKPIVDKLFSEMVYEGLWHSPLVKALCAFVDVTQEKVSGWVKVKLYKGSCQVVARSSPNALYNLNLATYEKTSKFNQLDSIGFIKLFGLNTVLSNQLGKAKKGKEGMSLDD